MKTKELNTKAMYKLSYGLFVCTAVSGEKKNGCINNTAAQTASDPNRISIAINKANLTHDMVKKLEPAIYQSSVTKQTSPYSNILASSPEKQ